MADSPMVDDVMKNISLFLLLFVISCSRAGTPQGWFTQGAGASEEVSRNFVEAYYSAIDLSTAANLSDGLARQKIDEELSLRSGESIGADTRRPKVQCRLRSKSVAEEEAVFLYEILIQPADYDSLTRLSRITVRKRSSGWRVTQFSEASPSL